MNNKKNDILDVFETDSTKLSQRATADPTDRAALSEDDLSNSEEVVGASETLAQKTVTQRPIRSANGESTQQRKKRVPIGTQNRLNFRQEPGFHYRMVTDLNDGDRVRRFTDAGYERVIDPHAKGGDDRAGADSQMGGAVVRSVGGGRKGVLMRISQDLYDEDQAAKQQRVDQKEAALMRTPIPGQERVIDNTGSYGKVEIAENRR